MRRGVSWRVMVLLSGASVAVARAGNQSSRALCSIHATAHAHGGQPPQPDIHSLAGDRLREDRQGVPVRGDRPPAAPRAAGAACEVGNGVAHGMGTGGLTHLHLFTVNCTRLFVATKVLCAASTLLRASARPCSIWSS